MFDNVVNTIIIHFIMLIWVELIWMYSNLLTTDDLVGSLYFWTHIWGNCWLNFVGFVWSLWRGVISVNSDECLMTRMQEMSLDYHFTVEQEVGSSTYAFFGFNGNHPNDPSLPFLLVYFLFCSWRRRQRRRWWLMMVNWSIYWLMIGTAGVWRIAAINEAGGWKDRTTVEDMDLAVRASLKGWKFVYVGDLQVFVYPLSTLNQSGDPNWPFWWKGGPSSLVFTCWMELII